MAENLFQRRPKGSAPSMTVRKTTNRPYGRRKRQVSSPDRAVFFAMIVLAAILVSLGLLMCHLLGKGGGTNADATNQDRFSKMKMWKPRPVRRVRGGDGLGATEKALETSIIDKESGRHNSHSMYRSKFEESELGYDIYNCPDTPLDAYPRAWKATDVLENWDPNDTTTLPPAHRDVYQGLCIFDYQKQYDIARAYRDAEKPFIIRNDPNVMAASKRWSDPHYLLKHLPDGKVYTERSPTNHFMFYNAKLGGHVKHWKQPANDAIGMTYREWLERALEREAATLKSPEILAQVKELRMERIDEEKGGRLYSSLDDDEIVQDNDTEVEKRSKFYYLRINGWVEDAEDGTDKFIFDELPFFDPRKKEDSDLYFVDPAAQRGVNCRFGMRGIVAENHFDLSRNMLAVLEGQRRIVVGHPSQCKKMALYPREHPSGRHSSFDWSYTSEWDVHPAFKEALVSEVVIDAGDVLYLPTSWFHYIVNLSKNIQCNIRSGIGYENLHFTKECGFDPSSKQQ
ncbi:hypothetical protein ACHAXR_009206 [Thalassiosira sp. AJA248-18]